MFQTLHFGEMAPIDQSGALMQVNPLQPQHAHGHSVPSIQLSTLIEYVTQRTYHELTVLSELYVFLIITINNKSFIADNCPYTYIKKN